MPSKFHEKWIFEQKHKVTTIIFHFFFCLYANEINGGVHERAGVCFCVFLREYLVFETRKSKADRTSGACK